MRKLLFSSNAKMDKRESAGFITHHIDIAQIFNNNKNKSNSNYIINY